MRRARNLWILGTLSVLSSACVSTASSTGGSREVGLQSSHLGADSDARPVEQAELQQDIQRLAGQFMAAVSDALQPLTTTDDVELRETSTRRLLMYQVTALDIATGPLPEVNVLDWVVMVRASRAVAERYWVPRVFGSRGQPLQAALAESEGRAWRVSGKILGADQQTLLREIIDGWLATHPEQRAVEAVRLSDFSARAGTVSAERAEQARGLLSGVKQATQTADQAMLLAERGMFLLHRMPFVLRLQARLGVQESLDDAFGALVEGEAFLEDLQGTRPLLHDVLLLSDKARSLVQETEKLARTLEPLFPKRSEKVDAPAIERVAGQSNGESSGSSMSETLATVNEIADRTLRILHEARELAPEDLERRVDVVEQRADRMIRRWLGYLLALGAGLSFFFWGGYFIVKRWGRPKST